MPNRTDISFNLGIGARPIVIGQACEFDYSDMRAINAPRGRGYRLDLADTKLATITPATGR